MKPQSRCRIDHAGVGAVFDIDTGDRAVIFFAAPPERESETDAMVLGGHHYTGIGGGGFSYRVRYTGAEWVVVASRQLWIS